MQGTGLKAIEFEEQMRINSFDMGENYERIKVTFYMKIAERIISPAVPIRSTVPSLG